MSKTITFVFFVINPFFVFGQMEDSTIAYKYHNAFQRFGAEYNFSLNQRLQDELILNRAFKALIKEYESTYGRIPISKDKLEFRDSKNAFFREFEENVLKFRTKHSFGLSNEQRQVLFRKAWALLEIERALSKETIEYDTSYFDFLPEISSGEKVLEVGSGYGGLPKFYAKNAANLTYYANDIDSSLVYKRAREFYLEDSIYAVKGHQFYSILGHEKSTNLENITFDKILIMNGVHHFSKVEEMLKSIWQSCHEKTKIYIFENVFTPFGVLTTCPYVESKETITSWFEENGFKLLRMEKISSNSYKFIFEKEAT